VVGKVWMGVLVLAAGRCTVCKLITKDICVNRTERSSLILQSCVVGVVCTHNV
jgi:hypothetical protein